MGRERTRTYGFKQRNATLITSWPMRVFLPYINLGQFYCSRAMDNRTCLVKYFSYMTISILKSIFSHKIQTSLNTIICKAECDS